MSGGLLVANDLLMAMSCKALRLAAFDPALATTPGFDAIAIRLGLTLADSVA